MFGIHVSALQTSNPFYSFIFQLQEVGLDLNFVLDRLFMKDIEQAVNELSKTSTEKIASVFDYEHFALIPSHFAEDLQERWALEYGDIQYPLSESTYEFFGILTHFGKDLHLLMSIPVTSE
jgi:hypothetical protein